MTYPAQMEQMRSLIREHLIPRVVRKREDGLWECELCQWTTEIGKRPDVPASAKHGTFCPLGVVVSVVE